MGEVHIARHRSGRLVAIKKVRKTLSLDPALCERLSLEANILRRIDHPNVVSVLDGGIDSSGQPFLVMSRAFGTPLDTAISDAGTFSRDRITAIMSQLLDGLTAIHEAGVIHADLKSSNVLIDELDRVTIIDFGLARVAAADANDDEIFGGTPAYMAPELLGGGSPSTAADIYAAGVIVYEMLTGSAPLARNLSAMVMLQLRMHEPAELASKRAPNRGITPAIDAVLARALARKPEDRFATVRDLADALAVTLAAWVPTLEDAPTMYKTRAPSPENLAQTLTALVDEATLPANRADVVISRALGEITSLVASRDIIGAVRVLEDALAKLIPADASVQIAAEAWRLETVLAALYQSLGKKDHANRLARVAYQHAQRSGNKVAEARTSALILQLSSEQTRLARGSRQVPLRSRRR
jgi:serine/threonine-protein kinase